MSDEELRWELRGGGPDPDEVAGGAAALLDEVTARFHAGRRRANELRRSRPIPPMRRARRGHSLADCDRRSVEVAAGARSGRAFRRIPSPADLRLKPIDYGPRITARIAEAVQALRDSGVRARRSRMTSPSGGALPTLSEAGWVTRIERMHDGRPGYCASWP